MAAELESSLIQRPIHDGERSLSFDVINARQPQHGAQLVGRHVLDRAWRSGLPRPGLWEGRGASRVKRDVTFDFLHGLVDVAVQDRDGAEALEQAKCLARIFRAPAPLLVYRPQWNVGK